MNIVVGIRATQKGARFGSGFDRERFVREVIEPVQVFIEKTSCKVALIFDASAEEAREDPLPEENTCLMTPSRQAAEQHFWSTDAVTSLPTEKRPALFSHRNGWPNPPQEWLMTHGAGEARIIEVAELPSIARVL